MVTVLGSAAVLLYVSGWILLTLRLWLFYDTDIYSAWHSTSLVPNRMVAASAVSGLSSSIGLVAALTAIVALCLPWLLPDPFRLRECLKRFIIIAVPLGVCALLFIATFDMAIAPSDDGLYTLLWLGSIGLTGGIVGVSTSAIHSLTRHPQVTRRMTPVLLTTVWMAFYLIASSGITVVDVKYVRSGTPGLPVVEICDRVPVQADGDESMATHTRTDDAESRVIEGWLLAQSDGQWHVITSTGRVVAIPQTPERFSQIKRVFTVDSTCAITG